MSPSREAWAEAFMRQGDSDLAIYELLEAQSPETCPRCHALHYLQMACEKIGKAYRARHTSAELFGEEGLLRRHVGFEKFISSYLLSPQVKSQYQGKSAQLKQVRKAVLPLARQIEKIAPAVDEDSSPQNAEYPWQEGDSVVAPCEHDFSRLSLLREEGGRTLLKLVKQAVREF